RKARSMMTRPRASVCARTRRPLRSPPAGNATTAKNSSMPSYEACDNEVRRLAAAEEKQCQQIKRELNAERDAALERAHALEQAMQLVEERRRSRMFDGTELLRLGAAFDPQARRNLEVREQARVMQPRGPETRASASNGRAR